MMRYTLPPNMQNLYAFGNPTKDEISLMTKNGFQFYCRLDNGEEMWIADVKNPTAVKLAKENQ